MFELEVVEVEDTWSGIGTSEVQDPLGRVSWRDNVTYDAPEDCTTDRNLAPWIAEVNRLRQALAEATVECRGILVEPGVWSGCEGGSGCPSCGLLR